ncbi:MULTISPECIES: fumarylacetoacetate hydrolase family protein [unclassified Novosphingobium]|uniref:fumarylacetoacetate hydrolase family protein n=1 Tax=unclassified Novosphingobium TaxID=2644732 RepID=UPI00020EE742|nr:MULTISPECIES: fumarylacetoacetate hydrolase family protein [unclassified Novosphingobium]GFM27962.1 fumarylacetoacetate (FAA) hydrolase [Novosphingobium sp. PY1]CCA91131.1 fumarylacetoacetate (FAA) hydrolase [Novosphingobium sp. PP1Y]
MTQLFETLAPVLAKTSDGNDFPVRRVFCIGRNYADHAKEMGVEVDREAPFYFTKWAETVIPTGSTMAYPPMTQNFHYEAELVVAIGKGGRNIDEAQALDHIYGYATGLDMTRRDLQLEARSKGRPWDAGKNVEQSSPLGLLHPISETGELTKGRISLTVNGEVKQDADLADLIHSVPALIAYISKAYRLEPGDLIYTGTPAGVGAVLPGDEIVISIEGLSDTVIKVGPPLDA